MRSSLRFHAGAAVAALVVSVGGGISFEAGAIAQTAMGKAGSPVGGLHGAIWVDANNDGRTDGYVQDGRYIAGAPAFASGPAAVQQGMSPAPSAAATQSVPSVSRGAESGASDTAASVAPTKPYELELVAARDAKLNKTAAAETPDVGQLSPAWDYWGKLAGTYWHDAANGYVFHYRWKLPGEILETFVVSAKGEKQVRISLDADGLSLTSEDGVKYKVLRPGVSQASTPNNRSIYRRSGNTIFIEWSQLQQGQWVPTGNRERRRITPKEANERIAELKQKQQEGLRTAQLKSEQQAQAKAERARRLEMAKASHYTQYGHLRPPDHSDYIYHFATPLAGAKSFDLTLYSCVPNADFRSRGAEIVQRDQRIGRYYVSRLRVRTPGKRIKYSLDAGSDASVGEPFLLVGTAHEPESVLVEELGPTCSDGRELSQQEIAKRFGNYLSVVGKTYYRPPGAVVYDVKWLRPGAVLLQGCRMQGTDRGRNPCGMYSYDEKNRALRYQILYEVGEDYFVRNKSLTGAVVVPWQHDIRQRKAQSGGGLFGKVLQGALAGAQGMVDGGSGVDGAIAGAVMGAAAGGAGVDAGTINQSFQSGSSEVNRSNDAARAQFESAMGEAGASASAGGAGGGSTSSAVAEAVREAGIKPPVDMPGCGGFDMETLKMKSAPGELDAQLYGLCAGALNYYAQYTNAVGQGYGAADLERAYDAHRKAALVANDYYANNRAN